MKNIRFFLSEYFQFLEVKFSIYLNSRVQLKFSLGYLYHRFIPSWSYIRVITSEKVPLDIIVRPAKIQISLRDGSSLGAQARRYVFSSCGSYNCNIFKSILRRRCINVIYPLGLLRNAAPSGHTVFKQCRINVDATSWRCIDVNETLFKRH